MTQGTRKRLTALLMVVCIFSTFMFLRQLLDNAGGSEAYANALEVATSQEKPPAEPVVIQAEAAEIPETTAPPEPVWIPAPLDAEDPHIQTLEAIDLGALQGENPDVLGWIFLPDTPINYPIMQGEDNEYYLNHTWNGIANTVGSIFMETRNTPDFTDFNTILYGHNMMDGSMFAHIHRYSSQSYWENQPYVYLKNAEGIFRYEIFSSYQAQVDSSTYGLSFHQTETRVGFLEAAAENSVIDTGIEPAVTDRILTLSTCSGAGYTTRWVLHARLAMIQAEA